MASKRARAPRKDSPVAKVKRSLSKEDLVQAKLAALVLNLEDLIPTLKFRLRPRFVVVVVEGETVKESVIIGGTRQSGASTKLGRGDWICWVNNDNLRYTVDFFVNDASTGGKRNPFVPSTAQLALEPFGTTTWARISQSAVKGSGDGQKYDYHLVPDKGTGGGPDGPDIIIE